MRPIRPAEKPGRDVPALAVLADDRDGLPIVPSQHAHDAAVSLRLKGDAITDLELEHLGMCSHLSQELKTGNDSVVQVEQFRLGQLVDVDPHPHLARRPRPAHDIRATSRNPGPPVDPRSLRDAIAREESRLLHLQTELGQAQARLAELKTTLAAHEGPVETSPPVPSTALEKVALFRSRFRGRHDIYPRFWSNARTGRKGYAPVCGNEWIPGVCEKPRVKCGECPNQAFLPVEDKVIVDHLQGRHVVGVYPLLTDETCWFLAADFDKASWSDDVAAFAETCRAHDLPAAVERSRSGNGAHVWFFFSAPVAASAARQMGCHLITETMNRRHQLSMRSYDRLFPNQDTLPRGGFGNLIALPLQHGPRQMGNTVFVDDQFVPHPDQWRFPSKYPCIGPATVESVAREAMRSGRVVGVRLSDTSDSEGSEPWTRRPSGQPPIRFSTPLPRELRAVLAQRLFVAKGGLAPTHLNQIKRLAAFQNPEFYKKQSLRLSFPWYPRHDPQQASFAGIPGCGCRGAWGSRCREGIQSRCDEDCRSSENAHGSRKPPVADFVEIQRNSVAELRRSNSHLRNASKRLRRKPGRPATGASKWARLRRSAKRPPEMSDRTR